MSKKFILAAGLLLCSSLSFSAEETANARPGQLPLPLDEVRLFTEALDAIRSAYVEEIDDKTLLTYAIQGMLAGLDPHSDYLSVEAYDSLNENTQGEFGGLGIEIADEDGYIRVITPIDDTPAKRAGVMPGDLIIAIDGKPLRELPINQAVELMRGEIGTSIVITILRENEPEPFDLELVREAIAVTSVRHHTLEPGFGYLRISQFKVNTGEELLKSLRALQEENDTLNGLVLDLRNNPGGVLQASVAVVDAFISEGKIVYTQGRFDESELDYYATRSDPSQGVPLVVLINTGSASAAEIVAGALQDHGRAVIMGTRSFGKGSVQTVMPLANDRALKLTTALYFTPDGRSIQAQGIEPDIEVDEAFVTRQTQRRTYTEADLSGHLLNADGAPEIPRNQPRPQTSAEQVVVTDYQLNEALTLLKGWHIMDRGRQRPRQTSTTRP
ncbi:MAG: S41 family peptidase [Pseudomonadales bacterium]|nr:S41 family peptidase [Pseudomonadales bacterium]